MKGLFSCRIILHSSKATEWARFGTLGLPQVIDNSKIKIIKVGNNWVIQYVVNLLDTTGSISFILELQTVLGQATKLPNLNLMG